MIGALGWIAWNVGGFPFDQPLARGIKHGLIFLHRVDQRGRIIRSPKQDLRRGTKPRKVGPVRSPEHFKRIRPQMRGTVFVGKELAQTMLLFFKVRGRRGLRRT